jgi:hypothetical protein
MMSGQELADPCVNIGQALLLRQPGTRLDDAAGKRHELAVAARHDPVPGAGQPGIYTENDHAP